MVCKQIKITKQVYDKLILSEGISMSDKISRLLNGNHIVTTSNGNHIVTITNNEIAKTLESIKKDIQILKLIIEKY